MVEANREREAQAKDTIQQLKLEISNLTRLVEQGAGLNLGPEETARSEPRYSPSSHSHPPGISRIAPALTPPSLLPAHSCTG